MNFLNRLIMYNNAHKENTVCYTSIIYHIIYKYGINEWNVR